MKKLVLGLAVTVSSIFSGESFAAGGVEVPKQEWPFQSITHSWDKAQIMRGYQVATQVCLTCHSFKYIKHRHLMDVGFTEAEVKALAAKLDLKPNDKIMSDLSAEDGAALYGKPLPDLSVMTRARPNGPDYVYAVLTGYEEAPEGFELPEGAYYNKYFPGHSIAMPKPITENGQVQFFDNEDATIEDMARDVTYFLTWTAEPEMVERQHLGVFVIIYLIILTILLYKTKKHIWRDVKKK